ncbi:Rossmann-fold NAD(P)-binding domain-containing protein [Streptomyces narbonensis]|uniref:NmrA family transcriptional regulator n=1 Tax=Streptomyces narbonensis TaxID=67333 RepID=UPI001674882D|nr:NmrA family transcriptional regulator [Streptomyces narbonensis]GGV95601.1 NmrA family transcriptional regulator [Streptomyces narbonensis]
MTTNTQNTQNTQKTQSGNGGRASAGARTILVTSATGKTGRRVAERLAARGVTVRHGSRTGATPFDWEAPETWGPALRGADAAYVAYYPDLAAPGAVEAMRTFGRLAVENGVRRLTVLSGRGEPEAVVAEGALREAAGGVEMTVVRASFFAQNFSEGLLAEGVAEGMLVFPAGDTLEPFVDVDDLADVIVETLTADGHAGRVHEVTGPRPVSFAEVAAEISRVSGRPVVYEAMPAAEYAGLLTDFGLPAPEAEWLAALFATLLDGHNASATDGVKRVLGREPRSFAAFAAEAWGGPTT